MNDNKLAIIGTVIIYCTVFICFTVLAIVTQKWWIILFSWLLGVSFKIEPAKGDDEEDE